MSADPVAAMDDLRRLLAVLVVRLQDAVPTVARVVGDVRQDWRDIHGRAWVERAVLVHRELGRELDAAVAAAGAVGRIVDEGARVVVPGEREAGVPVLPSGRAGGRGPRLGGTDAERVDDDRGMRIARLSDDGSG